MSTASELELPGEVNCGESEIEDLAIDRAKWLPRVRELSRLRALPLAWAALVQWTLIAASIAAVLYTRHWAVYLLAVVVIATRQHALAILMHEGAHRRIARNRTTNDLVSDLFFGFPMLLSTSLYRRFHFGHHRYTNTEQDPQVIDMSGQEDWEWPKLWRECVKVLFMDITGINTRKIMKILNTWNPMHQFVTRDDDNRPMLNTRERVSFLLFLAAVIAFLTLTKGWLAFLLLWVVPASTLLGFIFRIRAVAEHLCVPDNHELNATRTVLPTPFETFLICPCNINLHIEHHLFPSVPFYNLKKLHRLLMEDPVFAKKALVTRGYFSRKHGLMREIIREEEAA